MIHSYSSSSLWSLPSLVGPQYFLFKREMWRISTSRLFLLKQFFSLFFSKHFLDFFLLFFFVCLLFENCKSLIWWHYNVPHVQLSVVFKKKSHLRWWLCLDNRFEKSVLSVSRWLYYKARLVLASYAEQKARVASSLLTWIHHYGNRFYKLRRNLLFRQ